MNDGNNKIAKDEWNTTETKEKEKHRKENEKNRFAE